MKYLSQSFILFLFSFVLIACQPGSAQGEEKQETTKEETSKEEPSVEEDLGHEGTFVSYPDDWGAFRSALTNKSEEGVQSFMAMEDMEARDLIDMATEEVTDDMFETDYSQLEDSDYNGIKVKEYSYQETGTDEEGNEIGWGLFFYFEEQKEGLRLIGFLAAG